MTSYRKKSIEVALPRPSTKPRHGEIDPATVSVAADRITQPIRKRGCLKVSEGIEMDNTELLLRKFEREQLDKHHQTLPLFQRSKDVAVFGALAAFDSMVVPLALVMPFGISPSAPQRLMYANDGIIQALRFLVEEPSKAHATPVSQRSLLDEAGRFLAYCTEYAQIADAHVTYGRGMLDVSIDGTVIRFTPKETAKTELMLLGMVEHGDQFLRWQAGDHNDSIKKIRGVKKILPSIRHRLESGTIILEDLDATQSAEIDAFSAGAYPPGDVLLPPEADLGGFCVEEFEQFWRVVLNWSVVCTGLFLEYVFDGQKPQWECLPTQIVDQEQFLDSVTRLSGLEKAKIDRIFERLRYGWGTSKPDIFLQPFLSNSSKVAWSPYLIQITKRMRNLLKQMARTPALKHLADNLIGLRSHPLLKEIGLHFAKQGYQYKLTTDYGGGDIDLLAYHTRRPEEVLLIEGKAFLGSDEVNEVNSDTMEMIKGQEQLKKNIAALLAMPNDRKAALFKFVRWEWVKDYFGVVITTDSYPNARYDHSEIPAISLPVMNMRLRESHYRRPKKFWEVCKEKRWLNSLRRGYSTYRPIKVGDLTYEIPITLDNPNEDKLFPKERGL